LIAWELGYQPPEEAVAEKLTPDDLLQMFPMPG